MIRNIHTGLLLAAAVGLGGGAVACGTSSASVDPSQQSLAADASAGAMADVETAPPAPASIRDCSEGQAAAIAQALIGAEVSSASQAAMLSMNRDVQRLARQVLDDAKRFQQQLQSSDIQPVENDISQQITAQARASLVALRATPDIDRNYLASQIVNDMQALAFIDHLKPSGGAGGAQGQGAPGAAQDPGASAGSQAHGAPAAMPASGRAHNPGAATSFATDSRNAVQSNLQTALALQRKLVGACGTFAPAPMGGPSGAPVGAQTGAAPTGAAAEAGAPASSITPRPH